MSEWQFDRKRHGSLYDRGRADSYYGRPPKSHYGGVLGNSGPRVEVLSEVEVKEYKAGFKENEAEGFFKDWN